MAIRRGIGAARGDGRATTRGIVPDAYEHSPTGGTISLGIEGDSDHLRLTVDDEGPGIAPEIAATLFERFTSGSTESNAAPGLAGLGLDYCRRTIQRWGGSLGHAARQPTGARFWVELPRPRAD